MVKKLKTLAKGEDKQLAIAVRTSAQQIWQAGLGAFAKAQEEGGRVFSKLVKEGTEFQKRTQNLAENKVSDVTGTVTKMADDVGKQASGSWDKLEQVFEDRVARALNSIGVPTRVDVEALSKRIEQLSKAVMQLSGQLADDNPENRSADKPVVQKPAAKKPAAKKPAFKQPVAATGATEKMPKVATKAAPKPVAKAAPKPAAQVAAKAAPKPAAQVAAKAAPKRASGAGFPTAASVSKAAAAAIAKPVKPIVKAVRK
jgi:poly(hydroxyalkanoate) granule-associated protein